MGQRDDQQEDEAGDRCNGAVCARAVGGGSGLQRMRCSRARDHAENGDRTVAVAFACEDKLAKRAAAEQSAAPADDGHAEQVPQPFGVGDGLTLKAKLDVGRDRNTLDQSAQQITAEDGDKDAAKGSEKTEFLEHNGITNTADHAKTALLRDSADDQADAEGNEPRRVHGTRAAFGGGEEGNTDKGEDKTEGEHNGEGEALNLALLIGPAEGEAILEEKRTEQDAEDEADQTDDGVQVAAADADNHAQRAAEEDQRADHNSRAEGEAEDGRTAALRLKLLADKGHEHRADNDTDDLGTEVLYNARLMQLGCAGDVAQEASDTEAHIFGVAKRSQYNCGGADEKSAEHDEPVALEEIFFFHTILSFCFLNARCDSFIFIKYNENGTVCQYTAC